MNELKIISNDVGSNASVQSHIPL